MAYCKDLETMTTLPAPPADLQVTHRYSTNLHKQPSTGHSQSVRGLSTPPLPSTPIPITRSESVPEPGSTSSRQSSPMPSSAERNKISFPFRGSTTGDKIANRKSTPEFDRKQSPSGASHDGSAKGAKKVYIYIHIDLVGIVLTTNVAKV